MIAEQNRVLIVRFAKLLPGAGIALRAVIAVAAVATRPMCEAADYSESHSRNSVQSPCNRRGHLINNKKQAVQGDFLPNLCSVQAVFHLILVGELLAIALTVVEGGVVDFRWNRLGVLSILIQWIVLTSAASLCPLRPWFKRQPPMLAGTVSYSIVLAITVLYSIIGGLLPGFDDTEGIGVTPDLVLTNLMLAAVFAGIVLRYFYLQQQLQNQQKAELNARIQALQARIRPHFLFNSMNSIASLIAIDPEAAEDMVVDLSELFRASLSEPGLIALQKELDLCRRFVAIEQIRIGDRLLVDWDVDELKDTVIPSLLLQPLIENAIYHGIQPLPQGGTVQISVKAQGGNCAIKVINPVGDKSQSVNKGNGLALENIGHRLEAHYGHKASMSVVALSQTYTVSLVFPSQPPAVVH